MAFVAGHTTRTCKHVREEWLLNDQSALLRTSSQVQKSLAVAMPFFPRQAASLDPGDVVQLSRRTLASLV